MTRFVYDQFAKEFLEELLKPFGFGKAPREVKGEVRQIDVWFAPNTVRLRNLFVKGDVGVVGDEGDK